MSNKYNEEPVYQIGVVSRLLGVHPETIRGWENSGIIKVSRINNRRYFSQNDIKRLRFAQKMMNEGINLPALSRFLKFYPCWYSGRCPECMHPTLSNKCGKLCWRDDKTYCIQVFDKKQCSTCWVINSEGIELSK
jgi:MerR family transcriptional regulator/heat shock protein HspR